MNSNLLFILRRWPSRIQAQSRLLSESKLQGSAIRISTPLTAIGRSSRNSPLYQAMKGGGLSKWSGQESVRSKREIGSPSHGSAMPVVHVNIVSLDGRRSARSSSTLA